MTVLSFARAKRALLSLCMLFPVLAFGSSDYHDARVVWLTLPGSVLKVTPTDGSVTLQLAGLKTPGALTVEGTNDTVWSYGQKAILGYDSRGNALLSVSLPANFHGGIPSGMAVDNGAGNIWIAIQKDLYRLDMGGEVKAHITLATNATGVSLDADQSRVWVAEQGGVEVFDAAGSRLPNLALSTTNPPTAIAYDTGLKQAWVLFADHVVRYDDAGNQTLQVQLSGDLGSFIAPDGQGGAWVSGIQNLARIDASGQAQFVIQPFAGLGGGNTLGLAADAVDHSVWLANSLHLRHYDSTGAFLLEPQLPAGPGNGNGFNQLALYVDTIPPTVSITAPADGSYTNHNRPELTLSYSDIGSGVDPANVAVTNGGTALPVTCQANPDGSGAACILNAALPDGGYTLSVTVKDYTGNVSKPATVTFTVDTVPPTITVTSPSGPYTNQPNFTLAGSISEAGTLTINGAQISLGLDNAFSDIVTLTQGDNSFTFVATDLAGNVSAVTKTINLNTIPPIPVVNGDIIITGPTNGTVTITGKSGAAAPNVSVTITDTKTGQSITVTSDATGAFTATLAAGGNDSLQITETDQWGNVTSDPSTIAVSNLPPDPASVAPSLSTTGFTTFADQTSFLYTGTNPIQTGVVAGAVDPMLVSAIRGKVMDASGNALPGVTITVFGHPEFGHTLSRADGYFDIAVNGGGTVTLDYALKDYLPAQRKVQTEWNAYTSVDTDVALIKADPTVTPVTFGSGSPQLVQGSVITDVRGTRQASVYFPAGTTATMTMPDGSAQPLANGSFRATEFTVGAMGSNTMPADVPTGSAYTYAVDLSFDEAAAAGATSVTFNQPVPVYLNNFLNVPVGYAVPNYYLDRSRGDWNTSDSGDVIKVLSLDASGNAVLAVDPAGKAATAAELTQLGITTAELGQIAQQFKAGSTFWRFGVTHFTVYDFNLGFEDSSVVANPQGSPKKPPCPDHNKGCDISAEYQTLGENIPVTGTPFVLRYDSNRQPGYTPDNIIHLQVTGATVPANLDSVVIRIDIAGEEYTRQVKAYMPNQVEDFIWDSHDRYGRVVYGQAAAAVHVGYVFNPVHYFALPKISLNGYVTVTIGAPNVATHPAWKGVYTTVGSAAVLPQGGASGIDGWSLSVHHALDPATRTVYLGDGSTRLGSNITTVVRKLTGCCGYLPRPAALTETAAHSVAVAPNGDIYFAGSVAEDGYTSLRGIFKIDHTTTMVTQVFNFGGDLEEIALAADGSIYYVTYPTTSNNKQIYRLATDGTTHLVAGLGSTTCPAGANCAVGGPAVDAPLQWIPKISVGPDGTLYFLSTSSWDGGTSVCEVKTDGTWKNITPGYDNWVDALAAAPDGSVYFGGGWSYRIYQWKPDGSITRVAGSGVQNTAGDGGPATQASFIFPSDVYAAPDGVFYINDYGRIRRVGNDGIITTVAGVGNNRNYPTPAIQAGGLNYPAAIAPDGTIKFATSAILSLEPAVPGAAPILGSSTLTGYMVTSDDGRELYTFDRSGRHLQTIDTVTKAVIYSFGYDASGNFISVTDANNRVTTINRDAAGNATSIVSPDGQVTTLTVDGNSYLQSVADPAGDTYKMATRPDGLLTSFTDPNGNPDTYSYDALGQLYQNKNAVGGGLTLGRTETLPNYTVTTASAGGLTQSYQISNNSDGTQSLIVTAPDGTVNQSLMNKDADSEVDTAADGTVTTAQFGADPRFGADVKLPTSTTIKTPSGLSYVATMSRAAPLANAQDPFSFTSLTDTVTINGQVFKSTFNPKTSAWTLTSPASRLTTTTIDQQERPTSMKFGDLLPVSYSYDSEGHIYSMTAGAGVLARSKQFNYYSTGPAKGLLQSVIDSVGNTVSYEYDSVGRLTSKTFGDGSGVAYKYDAMGHILDVQPVDGAEHQLTYDGVGQLQSYIPGAIAGIADPSTQYKFDLDGHLTEVDRPDGQKVTLGYDAGGRLSTVVTPSGAYTNSYSPASGRIVGITSPEDEDLSFTWDGFLNTGVTWSGPASGTLTRTLDANFRVTSLAVNGIGVAYSYDADGLIKQAGSLSITRSALDGLVTGTSLGSVTTSVGYDGFGEITSETASAAGTALYSVTYTRDTGGRVASKQETVAGTTSTLGYGYDGEGRLNSVTLDGAVIANYGYDADGNRASVNGVTVATYDAQDRLLTYGSNVYSYTAAGDLKSKTTPAGTTLYTYDVLGNLLEAKLADGDDIRYMVDGQNRRVAKIINGSARQEFLYQDKRNPIALLDGSGNMVQRYVYGTKLNVPDYIIQGSNTYRVITDQLGSPRLVVDMASGAVIERIDYDAWGDVLADTNPGFQPFGYAGGLYDQDTKLVRFGARDYDPEVGRWTTKDPALVAGADVNPYGYALNDPIQRIDLFGQDSMTYPQMSNLVQQNNLSGESDELIICIAWNESSFDPNAGFDVGNYGKGLMGVSDGAVNQVNDSYDDTAYTDNDIADPAKNVQIGSLYLDWEMGRTNVNNDVSKALKHYGPPGYPIQQILSCEQCLKKHKDCSNQDKQQCLNMIHP